jgi:hypothetical protein
LLAASACMCAKKTLGESNYTSMQNASEEKSDNYFSTTCTAPIYCTDLEEGLEAIHTRAYYYSIRHFLFVICDK